jgi:repressor LexA
MARARITEITPLQERMVAYIRESIADRGEAPTLAEIGAHFGMRSRASVHYHLDRCEKLGAIVRDHGRSRGIRLP